MKSGQFNNRLKSTVLLFFLFLSTAACSQMANKDLVPTIIPTIEVNETTVSASGEVVPEKQALLSFQNGAEMISLNVKEGQSIIEGDILVESNQVNQLTAIEAAEAKLADAEVAYDQSRRNYERKIRQDAFLANVEAAEAALEKALSDLESTTIRAPFSGTVIEIYANSFENVAPNEPILLIADMNTLVIQTTDLNEIDATKVSTGNKVQISFDAIPSESFPGEVVKINQKTSAGSGVNYTATIKLLNRLNNLRWGMSAFVVIQYK